MTTFETETNKTLRAEDMNGARIEILTDWTDFEACEHVANNAIINAYNAHKFKFATNAPTSGATMFDAMPYTSTRQQRAHILPRLKKWKRARQYSETTSARRLRRLLARSCAQRLAHLAAGSTAKPPPQRCAQRLRMPPATR